MFDRLVVDFPAQMPLFLFAPDIKQGQKEKEEKSVAEIPDCEEMRHSLFWDFWRANMRCGCPAIAPSHRTGYGCYKVHLMQRWALL